MMPPPKISIITASYNQAGFLERTILSVLSQNYPNLEYIIIDGGSTDGSVDIIKKYADKLSFWCSEPDRGQYNAINKGFEKSTGEIMAFLNADDVYLPWTLSTIASIFSSLNHVAWITSTRPSIINREAVILASEGTTLISKAGFLNGLYIPGSETSAGVIVQEGTFWRRSLWQLAGKTIDENYKLAGDFDLWCRFFQHADLYCLAQPLAAMTRHEGQRSNNMQVYTKECTHALEAAQSKSGISSSKTHAKTRTLTKMKKHRLTWMVGRRIFGFKAFIINPDFINDSYNFNWSTREILIY